MEFRASERCGTHTVANSSGNNARDHEATGLDVGKDGGRQIPANLNSTQMPFSKPPSSLPLGKETGCTTVIRTTPVYSVYQADSPNGRGVGPSFSSWAFSLPSSQVLDPDTIWGAARWQARW